jgi:hypothetical protein
MDGNTAGVFAWFAFLLFIALMVLAVWAWVIVALARPNWLLPLLRRPQPRQPETVVAEGTPWEPAEYMLTGSLEDAMYLADPNLTVGELRAARLDNQHGQGTLVRVEQPARRQVSTDFQPPARGWRYGDPR